LAQVDCVSRTFCMARDSRNRYLTYHHGRWSSPKRGLGRFAGSGYYPYALSCSTATWCMIATNYQATGGDYVSTYNGKAWSKAKFVVGSSEGLTSVSCVSRHFCYALDFSGVGAAFDGDSWHPVYFQHRAQGAAYSWLSVSCASSRFCVETGVSNNASTGRGKQVYAVFNGKRLSSPKVLTSARSSASMPGIANVTCVSQKFCLATRSWQSAQLRSFLRFDGSGWAKVGRYAKPGVLSASCGAPSNCFGVAGHKVVSRKGTRQDLRAHSLTSVSCAGDRFCLAVDSAGFAIKHG
jgi:hypothetical protein